MQLNTNLSLIPPAPLKPLAGKIALEPFHEIVQPHSLWSKICRVFHEVIERIKNFFMATCRPFSKSVSKEPPIPLTPIDISYLKLDNPSYNLERLSEIRVENSIQSVSTEAAFKSVPKKNPIHLGYSDPVDYQTVLGDRAIAVQLGLTALGILGISRGAVYRCMKEQINNPFTQNAAPYEICRRRAANIWQTATGHLFLASSALLLVASLYAHRKGWLGALLHDPYLGWRQGQIETVFRSAANELELQTKNDPAKAEKTAEKILHNAPIIETTLTIELGLPAEKAKTIVDILKNACKETLDPNNLKNLEFEKKVPQNLGSDPVEIKT